MCWLCRAGGLLYPTWGGSSKRRVDLGHSDPSRMYCGLPPPDSSVSCRLPSCWGVMLVARGQPGCCGSWLRFNPLRGWSRWVGQRRGSGWRFVSSSYGGCLAVPPTLLACHCALPEAESSVPLFSLACVLLLPFLPVRNPSLPFPAPRLLDVAQPTPGRWVSAGAGGGKRGKNSVTSLSNSSCAPQALLPAQEPGRVPVASSFLPVKACRGQGWDQFQGYFSYLSTAGESKVQYPSLGRWLAGSSLWRCSSQMLCSLALA